MGFQALLFCPDEKLARVVSQVLREVDFVCEPVSEPFTAVKKLMAQHYDAIVADCDNEQNISLIFKGARNSTFNQNSLAIAMVEGQAGVAKAYRIGANLVLTKPINVEQCKGTLRVARGLLRKNVETPATGSATTPVAAGAPTSAAAPQAPVNYTKPLQSPAIQSSTPQTAPAAMTAIASDKPAATSPMLGWPSAQAESLVAAKEASMAQKSTVPAVAPPQAELTRAQVLSKDVLRKESPKVPTPSALPAASPIRGAAAAPAPAPEKEDLQPSKSTPAFAEEVDLAETAQPISLGTPSVLSSSSGTLDSPSLGVPSFGALDQESAEGSGGSKKIFIGVAALLVFGLVSYFGWSRFAQQHSGGVPPQSVAVPQPSASTPAPADETPVPVTNSTASSSSPSPAATSRTSVPSSSLPSASSPARSSQSSADAAPEKITVDQKAKTPEKAVAPLVVKPGSPLSKKAAQSEDASALPPAPIANDAATPSDLSRLVPANANVAKPTLVHVNISQGVSQGLLIKRVEPVYPVAAIKTHLEGAVQIQATISKEGNIVNPKVLSGNPTLAAAALQAVRQWRYKPYYLDGAPVEADTQITINFKSN